MKTDTQKPIKQKVLDITTDPRLDELFDSKVLFPEKLAQANAFLAKHPLPENLKKQNL